MWTTPDIDDLQVGASSAADGYRINIRPSLMTDDLKPFVVTPTNPARRWADDMGEVPMLADPERPDRFDFSRMAESKPVFTTVFLRFPSLAAAKATSLGTHWKNDQGE